MTHSRTPRSLATRCAAIIAIAVATPAATSLTQASATTPDVAPAPAPAPAPTHYQRIRSAQVTVPPSSQVRATLTCPAGTNVVGGGAVPTGSSRVRLSWW